MYVRYVLVQYVAVCHYRRLCACAWSSCPGEIWSLSELVFLKCVKVCMGWNKRNNRNNMHGATIKIRHCMLALTGKRILTLIFWIEKTVAAVHVEIGCAVQNEADVS